MTRRVTVLLVATVVASVAGACQPTKSTSIRPWAMIVGDSTADNLDGYIEYGLGVHDLSAESVVQPGCGLVRGTIYRFNGDEHPYPCDPNIWNAHQERLAELRPSVVISLSIFEVFPRVVDGNSACRPEPMSPPCDALLLQLFEEKRIQFESAGAVWVILTTPPAVAGSDMPDDQPDFAERTAHLNALLETFAGQHPSVVLLDFASWVCGPSGQPPCPATVDGIQPRPGDGLHFSEEGAAWAAGLIVPALVDAFS